jgi:hypothetical protein
MQEHAIACMTAFYSAPIEMYGELYNEAIKQSLKNIVFWQGRTKPMKEQEK